MPESEIDRWRRYWIVEPWGPHRDNLHAAMICVQVLKPYMDKHSKIGIDDFMLKDAKELKRNRMQQFVSQLGASSKRAPVAKTPRARTKRK